MKNIPDNPSDQILISKIEAFLKELREELYTDYENNVNCLIKLNNPYEGQEEIQIEKASIFISGKIDYFDSVSITLSNLVKKYFDEILG